MCGKKTFYGINCKKGTVENVWEIAIYTIPMCCGLLTKERRYNVMQIMILKTCKNMWNIPMLLK